MVSNEQILIHPFIIGELACGNLRKRSETLEWLHRIPLLSVAHPYEVMALIERKRLYGLGLGWTDISLLASAAVENCTLWTLDKALQQATAKAGVRTYSPTVH